MITQKIINYVEIPLYSDFIDHPLIKDWNQGCHCAHGSHLPDGLGALQSVRDQTDCGTDGVGQRREFPDSLARVTSREGT